MAGVLHFRDPVSGNWVPLAGGYTGGIGPPGPAGPDGLVVSDIQPTAPEAELWVDTSTIATNVAMLTVSTQPASGVGTDVGHLWVQY